MALEGVVVQSSILVIITLTSVLSNGLLCALLIKRRQHFTPSTRFVLSLCSCDFVVTLLVLPFIFVSTLRRRWEFGAAWCSATAFFWLLATASGNLTLAVVALDRYFAIVRPLSYSVAGSKSGFILACVWILAVPASALPFFCGIRLEYEELHSMCLVQWEDSAAFTAFFLMLAFFLPALIMLICYGHIFQIACSKYKSVRLGKGSFHNNSRRLPGTRKLSWLSAVLQSPVKGFAVIFILLGSFLLFWIPYVTVTFLELVGLLPHIAPWQQRVALLASLVTLSCHPFVYGLLNRSIRKNFILLFGRQSAVRNTASPQRASTVGILDYVPAVGDWTQCPSLDPVQVGSETNSYVLHSLRKSSDDSGRYSLPSDKDSVTIMPPEVDVPTAEDATSSGHPTPIYLIYTK